MITHLLLATMLQAEGPTMIVRDWVLDDAESHARLEIERTGYRNPEILTIRMGAFYRSAEGVPHYWVHRSRGSRQGAAEPVISWTTSAACPAMRDVLESLDELEEPVRGAPRIGDEPRSGIADGGSYRVRTPAQYQDSQLAQIESWGSSGTPLAAWSEQMISALDPCWSEARPVPPERAENQ